MEFGRLSIVFVVWPLFGFMMSVSLRVASIAITRQQHIFQKGAKKRKMDVQNALSFLDVITTFDMISSNIKQNFFKYV